MAICKKLFMDTFWKTYFAVCSKQHSNISSKKQLTAMAALALLILAATNTAAQQNLKTLVYYDALFTWLVILQ